MKLLNESYAIIFHNYLYKYAPQADLAYYVGKLVTGYSVLFLSGPRKDNFRGLSLIFDKYFGFCEYQLKTQFQF